MMRRSLIGLMRSSISRLTSLLMVLRGHGPVHLLLISAAEIGFAWDGREKGWILLALPSLDAFGAYPAFSECYY